MMLSFRYRASITAGGALVCAAAVAVAVATDFADYSQLDKFALWSAHLTNRGATI